jgi:hypothetical protein
MMNDYAVKVTRTHVSRGVDQIVARRFGAIVRPGVMGGELADTPRASRSLSASVSADQATSKSGPTRPCRADRSPRYLLSLVGCIQLTARRQLD